MSTAVRHPTLLLIATPVEADATRISALLRTVRPAGDEPDGYQFARATTLAEAVAHLEGHPTDCAVVDVELAGSAPSGPGGLEIIEVLARHSPHVAFVALTGAAIDDIAVATAHAGPVDCLSKAALEGRLLEASIRHAIVAKRVERSLDEVQRIARVGSWQLDVTTKSVRCSDELRRLFGFGTDTDPGYDALIDRVHPDDRDAVEGALRAAREESEAFAIDHRIVLPDGATRWIHARGRARLDPTGTPETLIGTAQDITDQKRAAADLLHHELHDPLTGLPNRRLLVDRLSQALIRLGRVNSMVGVIHLDIDRFRLINDSLGHSVGDQLLVATATRLQHFIRPEDTLARLDGDEFVVLCEGLSDQAEAVGVADRICNAMTEPMNWDGGDLVVAVSAGIALATSTAVEAETLLRDAQAATVRAKTAGRARSAVFAETMRTGSVGRLDTETSLRHSITNGDLRVYYQPIVDLVNGQVLGHEALVRWAHPSRGLLGPEEFIAIAEETGLIVPLGAWVLREACLQAKRFQTRDPRWPRLMMSVNLSGAQLGQPDLVDVIASALRDADLTPEDLQLEMTESVLMDDAPTTITVLQTLSDLGVQLSIDDFGTGYSSLAYLRRFPVDVLKIDRTFVDGLGKDLEDSAIVAAVVNLADTLGFATIAEGVETELQRDCLVGLGCSRAQGFLFAHPVDAAHAETALDHPVHAGARP